MSLSHTIVAFLVVIFLISFYFTLYFNKITNYTILVKPNSGGLGNQLLGISSSLLLSLVSKRKLIGIVNTL